MKKILTLSVAVLSTVCLFSQFPEKMSYQAVVRNTGGSLVRNSTVGIKITIHPEAKGITYAETHTATTNNDGLVTLAIGGGVVVYGNFSTIDWSAGPYMLKTEIDPEGGTNYTITGSSQILTVPYALYAKKAESITGTITEIDPVFAASSASGITSAGIGNWNTSYGWGNHVGLYRSSSWIPSWTDITSKPTTISGYGITDAFNGVWGSLTGKPTFAAVATSGSYNDLINKPAILNSQWTTSGSNIYYNSGNVGIGTTNLGVYKLNVNGGSMLINDGTGLSGTLKLSGHSFIGSADWGNLTLSTGVNSGNAAIFLNTENTNRITISGNGNVGIGTSTPGYLLDVNGNIRSGGIQLGSSSGPITQNWWEFGVDNGGGTGIDFHANSSANDYSARIYRLGGNNGVFQISNTGTGNLELATSGGTLDLNSSGNVGIGTTTPVSKLDVKGEINVNNNKIINIATPINPTDAANKAYVDNSKKHFIGESYGGGIVFWVDESGQHGLIAATTDQSTGHRWYGNTDILTMADADGKYAGKINTAMIMIKVSWDGNGGFAAMDCFSCKEGGFGDWYLPSKEELHLMYVYLYGRGLGAFATTYYWSSTEVSTHTAWNLYFYEGTYQQDVKTYPNSVRCIRAF